MEYSQINTLTKFGPDDYSLWTLTLPREKIHEIRQNAPLSEGNLRDIFEAVPSGEEQPESICHFVFPHSMAYSCFLWIWARILRTECGITAALSGGGVRILWQNCGTS
ncbi:hypothetical protein [Lacrimispora sp. 38-1]|uniref:hypothetical protein n=1 Tax=Lacrimispora sp. 38-1 TaxID=3125778 RepID=UPI003CF66FEB